MNSLPSGPKPHYREEDLWRALKVIGAEGRIGRKQIAREMDIGEGSTRTILNQLKDRKLVESSPAGHSLTKAGRSKLREKTKHLVSIDAGDLTVGKKDVAVLVLGAGSEVRLGIKERDEAIKAGAKGATVLIFRDGRLQLPGVSKEIDEKVASEIKSELHPSDEDVIIIGSGETENEAEKGALAGARHISKAMS